MGLIKRTITVTDSEIANGVRESRGCCPVALAINEAMIGGFYALVLGEEFVIINPDDEDEEIHVGKLPDPARGFILDFDGARPVGPLTFPLDLPTEATLGHP